MAASLEDALKRLESDGLVICDETGRYSVIQFSTEDAEEVYTIRRRLEPFAVEVAAKAMKEAGSGSSQSFGGGPIHVSTRNFSIFQLYRLHREQPVASLTKVNSLWDDAEQHAGAYDFYVITGGTGEMIVGGKIANRQNLVDKDGVIPGEYRGQPIIGGQTFKVKAGDCLLIPPDQPHQPKPDAGGFSYVIMKINVGIYPWSLIR